MATNLTQIKSLARAYTEKAVEVLGGIMSAPQSPESARVAAATALLDRGWGKPTQPIAGDDNHDAIRAVTEVRTTIVDPRNTEGEGVHPTAELGAV